MQNKNPFDNTAWKKDYPGTSDKFVTFAPVNNHNIERKKYADDR